MVSFRRKRTMKTLRQEKLKVIAQPDISEDRYVLDDQVGFLMRIAMQRHTSIFTSRMLEGLTQTQFAALAKLYEVGPCSQNHLGRLIYLDAATITPLTAEEQRMVVKLLRKLA